MTGSYTRTSGKAKINIISNSGALEVALFSGIILLVIIIVTIGCVLRKRPERKQETMNDENPAYGVNQLSETYERQYSTNEAVDNNDYSFYHTL